jgi:hypothetical protein
MKFPDWHEEIGGGFAADRGRIGLIVRRSDDHRCVRFLVVHRSSGEGEVLLGSGSRDSLPEAIEAAESMADRLQSIALWRKFGLGPDL